MALVRLVVVLLILATVIYVVSSTWRYRKARGLTPVTLAVPLAETDLKPQKDGLRLLAELKDGRVSIRRALARYRDAELLLKNSVPKLVGVCLADIGFSVHEVADSLEKDSSENKAAVFLALTDYVPSVMSTYLNLPRSQRVADSEATKLVVEQLNVVASSISKLQNEETSKLMSELKAHRAFLDEKFKGE